MSKQTASAVDEYDKPKPGIFQIHWVTEWIIDLLDALSFLLLTFVGILTVASAFQGGKLIQDSAILTQAYSWSLGIGIEGQLSVMVLKAVKAGVNHKGGQAIMFWVVALILFGVSVATGGVVIYQEAYHVTFDEALQAVGVPLFLWDWGRVVTMYGLIMLGSATRYVKPKARVSLEEELSELDRIAQVNAAKQRNRAQAVKGFAGIARGAVAGAMGREDEEESPVEAVAFASVDGEGNTPPTKVDTKGFKVAGLTGYWWDTDGFQQYVLAAYGEELAFNVAQGIVKRIGTTKKNGNEPQRRIGVAGQSYIAPVFLLKKEAVRMYPNRQVATFDANVAGVFSE